MMLKLSIATTLASATLLLLIIQTNAAPIKAKHVRLLHFLSGLYVTIDLKTGSITASTLNIDATTLFSQDIGQPTESRIFKSTALVDQYLSMSVDDQHNMAHYIVTDLQIESSGKSGSSSGPDTNSTASGSADNDDEESTAESLSTESSSAGEIFQNWRVEKLTPEYSTLKIPVDDDTSCYLAFEHTGEPVANPCSVSPSDPRATITIEHS